jgi:hypothetical protein
MLKPHGSASAVPAIVFADIVAFARMLTHGGSVGIELSSFEMAAQLTGHQSGLLYNLFDRGRAR